MSEISIGSAVGAGFQLIARKPLAVMAWGLLRVLFAAAVVALYAPMIMGIVSDAVQAKASGGDGASQAAANTMMSHMMVMQGAGSLVNLVSLALSAVIACGVTRAVVHPERGAYAYLRLGAPEFFLAVITFAAGIVIVLGILVFMIPFIILVAVLAAQNATAAVVIVCGLGALALVAGLVYLLLRFAFVAPMMVDDGQFHLFDAWALTKGRVGSLFLIGLALVAIALAAEAVIGAFVIALGVAALGAAAGGLQNVQALFALGPAVIAARLAPWLIVAAVLAIPLQGCALAIFIAPWARAYRDITPASPAEAAPSPPPVQPAPATPSPSPA